MIIGFGSTETAFEADEERAFLDYVTDAFFEIGDGYVSKALHERAEAWLKDRAAALMADADRYKAGEHPDRYSYYFPSVLSDGSRLIATVKFHHINRRHALSPDGWGLLETTKFFHFEAGEARRKTNAA